MERKDGQCLVCGRPAAGVHYACMGCKVFYRRSLKRKADHFCFVGGNCSTKASDSERRCKACRFWKCHALMQKQTTGRTSPGGSEVSGESDLPIETKAENLSVMAKKEKTKNFKDTKVNSSHVNKEKLAVANLEKWSTEDWQERTSKFSNADSISNDSSDSGTVSVMKNELSADDAEKEDLFSSLNFYANDARSAGIYSSVCPMPDALHKWSPALQPKFSVMCKSLWCKIEISNCLVPLAECRVEQLCHNRQEIIRTTKAVAAAVDLVFGDQIESWTGFQGRPDQFAEIKNRNIDYDTMTEAVNYHNGDNIVRTVTFASLLPGMDQLDPAARRATRTPWKYLVCWMVHHSPFMIGHESFITMGEQQLHLSLFWMEEISEPLICGLFLKFSALIQDLGLTQTELYLLMAIVLLEPGNPHSGVPSQQLKSLHQHYVDVLLDSIKQRSSNTEEVAQTARKLERFFDCLYEASRVNETYFSRKYNADEKRPKCSLIVRYLVTEMQKS